MVRNYFRYELKTDGKVQLNPAKNYIMACFPHGICPLGAYATFMGEYKKVFPNHKAYTTALTIQFFIPFIRELFLSIGSVAVTAASIKFLLKQQGGNLISIIIGGAEEAKYSKRELYKIILKKRKGFIKMALENGASIVPVFTFGENEIFEAVQLPGIGLILPKGNCGILPNRVQVVTVVGQPIEVTKIEQPTKEDVDRLHAEFVQKITQLFDNNKAKYVKNPEKTFLEIV